MSAPANARTPAGSGGNSAQAQRQRLLEALRSRTLTTLQARREIDVLHVAARVMELRAAGHNILTHRDVDYTSEGHPHRVAKYTLMAEARAA